MRNYERAKSLLERYHGQKFHTFGRKYSVPMQTMMDLVDFIYTEALKEFASATGSDTPLKPGKSIKIKTLNKRETDLLRSIFERDHFEAV